MIRYKEALYYLLEPFIEIKEIESSILKYYYLAKNTQSSELFIQSIQSESGFISKNIQYCFDTVKKHKIPESKLYEIYQLLREIPVREFESQEIYPKNIYEYSSALEINKLAISILGNQENVLDYGSGQGK